MSFNRLFCIIRDTQQKESGPRELELSLESAAWPLLVGSGADCAIRIDDPAFPQRAAEIHGSGNHFYVKALADAEIDAHGVAIARGESARFEEVRIGRYMLRLDWRGEA